MDRTIVVLGQLGLAVSLQKGEGVPPTRSGTWVGG